MTRAFMAATFGKGLMLPAEAGRSRAILSRMTRESWHMLPPWGGRRGHDEPAKNTVGRGRHVRPPCGGSGPDGPGRRPPRATAPAARRWWSRAPASTATASAIAGRAWGRICPTSAAGARPIVCGRPWWRPTRRSFPRTGSSASSPRTAPPSRGGCSTRIAISVQLINPKEELKTYLRATLREYTIVDKGLMPSAEGKLTSQQVADIVTYLSSLKGT